MERPFPKSTSDFKEKDVKLLGIKFQGMEVPCIGYEDEAPQFLYIQNKSIDEIKAYDKDSSLTNIERSLCSYIVRVIDDEGVRIGTSESITDSFVNYILMKIGFSDYPLNFMIQPIYILEVEGNIITSIPKFSIESNKMVLFVDEDKHLNNVTPGGHWGEFHLAGELLAAAYNNYNEMLKKGKKRGRSQTLYAMRVIGTKFSFYEVTVSTTYLESLSNLDEVEGLTIFRYPGSAYNDHYDYVLPDERQKIIDQLMYLKSKLLLAHTF